MPRYLVERSFGRITDEEMLAAANRSDLLAIEQYPEITWEHSHICVDAEGTITSFCVYVAPDEQMVLDHANAFGGHTVTRVQHIADDITPDDIRQRVGRV